MASVWWATEAVMPGTHNTEVLPSAQGDAEKDIAEAKVY